MNKILSALIVFMVTFLAIILSPVYLPVIGSGITVAGRLLGAVFTYNQDLFLLLASVMAVLIALRSVLKG